MPTTPGVWAEVPPPGGLDGFSVTDGFAVGTDDLFFAGSVFAADGTPSSAHLLHWNHGVWTDELTMPPSTSGSSLSRASVHGTGPTDVWAVSGDQIFHRNSQGWSRFANEDWRNHLTLPLPFGQPMDLVRVRAGSPDNVWVAATAHMLQWNGQGWTVYNLNEFGYPDVGGTAGYNYNDFWIDGPDDVWIAGGVDGVGSTMEPGIVHHFGGIGFTRIGVGAYNVYALWRAGPGLLWAVNDTLSSMPVSRLEGMTAQSVAIAGTDPSGPQPQLTTLWGRGANDIWASGTSVVHFDGQQWTVVADAPPPTLAGLRPFDVVVTGDAGSVWLTSPGPRFFRMVQVKGP